MSDEDFDQTEELGTFDKAKGEARDWVNGKTLLELAIKMKEVASLKVAQEEDMKETNAWLDVLRMEAIPQKMEAEHLESPVKFDGVGRVSLTTDLLVSVKGGMKDKLFGWLQENKLGDIIQPGINSSTLKAFIKGRIKAGKEYPDDCLNVTPIEKASILK